MKKKLNYVLPFILLATLTMSCKAQTTKLLISNMLIKPDSSVNVFFGKEALDIIYSPNKVNLFLLKPMQKPDSASKMLGSFIIDKKIGSIEKSYYSIIQFLLADTANYKFDNIHNKCNFIPYVAYEFKKKNETAILFISFSCEQWGIEYKNKLKFEEFNCKKDLIRLIRPIFPNDEYIKTLK